MKPQAYKTPIPEFLNQKFQKESFLECNRDHNKTHDE